MQQSVVSMRETLARRAAQLHFSARVLADSIRSGSYRSLYYGQGIEFSGVRDYIPGDDIRAIDWNVTARMDRPYVKLFEEEHEMPVFLIVDCSYSMFTGARGRTRFAAAAESAALITLAAEAGGSPAGAVFFDGAVRFSSAPRAGQEQSMLLLAKIGEMESQGTAGSLLGGVLAAADKMLRRRTLIFVFSDFRATGWELPLAYLKRRHDVAAVRIIAPGDSELPEAGSVPFIDSETGVRELLPTSSAAFKKKWQSEEQLRRTKWRDVCLKRGAEPVEISTEDDPAEVLAAFFSRRRQAR